MRSGISRRGAPRTAQTGVAAIILLVIVVMGSLYALLTSINTATAQLDQRRADQTAVALRQAKEALIAWSATHANGPGHLLCPDLNNDGISNTISCGNADTRVGRLPWSTLGLPDLRDASGNRLWYAVSRCFLERASDPSCTYAVNSDTQGQLNVAGLMPMSRVVAIIFAPGPALSGQNRADESIGCTGGPPVAPQNCQAANFLEGENANAPAAAFEDIVTSTDRFETRRRCEQTDCPGGPFNDQLIVITHAELFDVVENAVAKRVEKEIAPKVLEYVTKWGIYPFAAQFDDQTVDPLYSAVPTNPGRAQSMYYGRDTHTNGLLPVAYDLGWTKDVQNGWVRWDSASFSATKLFGAGDIVSPMTCALTLVTPNPPPGPDDYRCVCSFTYDGGPITVAARGFVTNVARSFALDFASVAGFSATVDIGDGLGPQSATIVGLTNSLQGSGHARISFTLRKPPAFDLPTPVVGPATVTVTFAPPRFSELVDPASASFGWFVRNQWYRQLYYAITDGCKLGGAGCAAGVVVQGPGPSPVRSVLVLAGRNLAGGARGLTIAEYFEGQNAAGSPFFDLPAPDFTFQRGLRSPTFNDKVVVVQP